MADRRPAGEKQYSPLDDSFDLISKVVSGRGDRIADQTGQKPGLPVTPNNTSMDRVVEIPRRTASRVDDMTLKPKNPAEAAKKEETVVFKFLLPRSEFIAVKRILRQLEDTLESKIDISNLGRGWVTRLLTAEKEILEAARHQQKLKTPNLRDPLRVAEVDYTLATVQSVAFRRAEPVR